MRALDLTYIINGALFIFDYRFSSPEFKLNNFIQYINSKKILNVDITFNDSYVDANSLKIFKRIQESCKNLIKKREILKYDGDIYLDLPDDEFNQIMDIVEVSDMIYKFINKNLKDEYKDGFSYDNLRDFYSIISDEYIDYNGWKRHNAD